MRNLFAYIIILLVIGFFLYIKLVPYKDKLDNKFLGVFNFFHGLFHPILNFLKGYIKPYQVGMGLAIDLSQVIILAVFLFLLKFL